LSVTAQLGLSRGVRKKEGERHESSPIGMLLRETMLRRESPHKQFLRTALEIDAPMAVRLIRWIRRKGRGEL